MRVDAARMEKGSLIIETPDIRDAFRFVATFKAGENYNIEKAKKKRSIDANALAWVLLDKLAAALQIPKIELYRNAIKEIGGVSETVCVPSAAVERLISGWEHNGLGWQAETYNSKIEGCTNVTLYYGSSTFDTAQMSRLINNIIQDCEACGVETRPREEIDSLLAQWEPKGGAA